MALLPKALEFITKNMERASKYSEMGVAGESVKHFWKNQVWNAVKAPIVDPMHAMMAPIDVIAAPFNFLRGVWRSGARAGRRMDANIEKYEQFLADGGPEAAQEFVQSMVKNGLDIGPIGTAARTLGEVAGLPIRGATAAVGLVTGPILKGMDILGGKLIRAGATGLGNTIRSIPTAIDFVGNPVGGALVLGRKLSNSPVLGGAAFHLAGIGLTGYAIGSALDDSADPILANNYALNPYQSPGMESTPPTLEEMGLELERTRPMDNLGADGNLVFALHNMR